MSKVAGGVTTTYSYDRADRITTAGGVSYTMNANGNLIARGSDSFGFDQANRLTSAVVGATSATYQYSGDGTRKSKSVGGMAVNYTYDRSRGLAVLIDDGSRKYVWGLGLAYMTDSAGSVQSSVHADALHSVRGLTDSAGTLTNTVQRDAFGNVTQTEGPPGQPFDFTGELRDGETGFLYLRARMYDPALGRFISRDT